MLTKIALKGYKQYTENIIKSAEIKSGKIFYPTTIQKKEILEDGSIAVYLLINPNKEDMTISEVRLIDTNDEVWLTKQENIQLKGLQEGILYRFIIQVNER